MATASMAVASAKIPIATVLSAVASLVLPMANALVAVALAPLPQASRLLSPPESAPRSPSMLVSALPSLVVSSRQ